VDRQYIHKSLEALQKGPGALQKAQDALPNGLYGLGASFHGRRLSQLLEAFRARQKDLKVLFAWDLSHGKPSP
jgi:hypothetical protein